MPKLVPEKKAIGFDGGLLEIMCESSISSNMQKHRYESIPFFLRHWNESAGWSKWTDDHVAIDADELLTALEWMSASTIPEWLKKDYENYAGVFSDFVRKMSEKKLSLFPDQNIVRC